MNVPPFLHGLHGIDFDSERIRVFTSCEDRRIVQIFRLDEKAA